jgi:hypothetical protein
MAANERFARQANEEINRLLDVKDIRCNKTIINL